MATSHTSDQTVRIYADQLQSQTVWRRYANTFVSLIGTLAVVGTAVLDAGIDIPEPWDSVAVAVIAACTSLGIYRTKNGRTERGLRDLQEAHNRWIDEHRGCDEMSPDGEPESVETPVDPLLGAIVTGSLGQLAGEQGGRHRLGGLPTGSLG